MPEKLLQPTATMTTSASLRSFLAPRLMRNGATTSVFMWEPGAYDGDFHLVTATFLTSRQMTARRCREVTPDK